MRSANKIILLAVPLHQWAQKGLSLRRRNPNRVVQGVQCPPLVPVDQVALPHLKILAVI